MVNHSELLSHDKVFRHSTGMIGNLIQTPILINTVYIHTIGLTYILSGAFNRTLVLKSTMAMPT